MREVFVPGILYNVPREQLWVGIFLYKNKKQKKKKREKAVKIIKLPQTITLWFCLTRLWMRPNQTHFKNSPRLHRQGLNFYHLKYKQTLAKAQSSSLDLHCFFWLCQYSVSCARKGIFFSFKPQENLKRVQAAKPQALVFYITVEQVYFFCLCYYSS